MRYELQAVAQAIARGGGFILYRMNLYHYFGAFALCCVRLALASKSAFDKPDACRQLAERRSRITQAAT